jgi:hypothetical protein
MQRRDRPDPRPGRGSSKPPTGSSSSRVTPRRRCPPWPQRPGSRSRRSTSRSAPRGPVSRRLPAGRPGPASVPPHLMPWWPAADDGHGIEESVRRFASGTAEMLTRAAPLVWMVLGDETALQGYEHHERLRRLDYAELIPVLTGKHPLRAGLTRTRDFLLVLTGPTAVRAVHPGPQLDRRRIRRPGHHRCHGAGLRPQPGKPGNAGASQLRLAG